MTALQLTIVTILFQHYEALFSPVLQHQLRTCLVVELRGDVQALGLGQHIAGNFFRSAIGQLVGSGRELKFAPLYFIPCRIQLLPPQHQLRTRLVVEIRVDVQALRLGELVARNLTRASVRLNDGSQCQRKIAPTYFFPSRLHVSDSLEHVFVLFTCQFSNLKRHHCLKCCASCARTISEFQLHTKQRKKNIFRDVMRELGVGPRQMVRVSGMTYAIVHKLWQEL